MEDGKEFESLLEGVVAAVSHTFLILEEVLFLAELVCGDKAYYICFRHKHHQCWRSLLKVGFSYQITDLRCDFIYKEKIPILHTRRTTKLIPLCHKGIDEKCLIPRAKGLLTMYKGKVTNEINGKLGIWELNSAVILVLSYLKDVTGEIWSNDVENSSMSEQGACANSKAETINPKGYLNIGDMVTLYHVHCSNSAERTSLTCCGRSQLVTEHTPLARPPMSASCSSVLDVLHHYNIKDLQWLLDIKELITCSLCPTIVEEDVVAERIFNNERSILTTLIEEAISRGCLKPKFRSLLREFVLEDHQCIIAKKSPSSAFNITKIQDLKSEIILKKREKDENGHLILWDYEMLWKNHHYIVIGQLKIGESGVYELCDNFDSIKVQIIGTHLSLLALNGAIVALFHYSVVYEQFNIYTSGTCQQLEKIYLIVNLDNVIILRPSKQPSHAVLPTHEFELTITSKSNFLFNLSHVNSGKMQSPESKFFFTSALVTTYLDGRRESWNGVFRFFDELALYYPCINAMHKYTLKVRESVNTNIALKKSYASHLLHSLTKYFGTSECINIPKGAYLVNESVSEVPSKAHDIGTVLRSNFENDDLITVTGFIRSREMETSKYDSEKNYYLSEKVSNNLNAGYPGKKILRILLSESREYNSCAVWVYVSVDPKPYVQLYPLGLLPGMKIAVSSLVHKSSKEKKFVYLQSTIWTHFTILSLPNHEDLPLDSEPAYRSLKNSLATKGQFKVYAEVDCVLYANVKTVCKTCQSDMSGGNCTYVGCSSQDGGVLTINVQLIIDDGTARAYVTLNSLEHFQTVFQIPGLYFSSLCQEMVASCENFSYRHSKKIKTTLNANLLESQEAFALMCLRGCNHPLKFICRPFTHQSDREEIPQLFCLKVSKFHPHKEKDVFEKLHEFGRTEFIPKR